ncbi:hypothetical protein M2105_005424 [Paenibacillus sp. PastF-1]|nr:hypothetical protein [Paenibacillus sp. PastF-2]MDF9850957.1 hypothetical protein [Paenibacillus sp. PastM-2]MDF9857528.1 hypothetical protein [Paenibacillus sp. PastF-1]MDH6482831.1 hypothetical protein [Paenibacillus sp. PastH-2]MDH6510256.1 hypothetical protein [Paenibacillus sp. PastM-3]
MKANDIFMRIKAPSQQQAPSPLCHLTDARGLVLLILLFLTRNVALTSRLLFIILFQNPRNYLPITQAVKSGIIHFMLGDGQAAVNILFQLFACFKHL